MKKLCNTITFFCITLSLVVSLSFCDSEKSFDKLEIYGMQWNGLYIVSPKRGHVLLTDNLKISISDKRVDSISDLLCNLTKDSIACSGMSHYTAFRFTSGTDTLLYFLGIDSADRELIRKDNSYFLIPSGFTKNLFRLLSKEEQSRIFSSLPPLEKKINIEIPDPK